MRTLLASALLAAVPASPSLAEESFLLYSKGAWEVHYTIINGVPTCSASVAGDGVYFSLDTTVMGLHAWYISQDNNFGPNIVTGNMAVWIDNYPSWNTPAEASQNWVYMQNLHTDFLRQILNGNRLWIDQEADGRWDAWFSLDGSTAALYALSDCKQKL
jgi:hypothetical protein